jgi:hypothetical protein
VQPSSSCPISSHTQSICSSRWLDQPSKSSKMFQSHPQRIRIRASDRFWLHLCNSRGPSKGVIHWGGGCSLGLLREGCLQSHPIVYQHAIQPCPQFSSQHSSP